MVGKRRINYENVRCSKCGTDTTITTKQLYKCKDGIVSEYHYVRWYKNDSKTGYWCKQCYDAEKQSRHKNEPVPIGQSRKEDMIHYKHKWSKVDQKHPRVGVCNWCRAVKGLINAQTGRLCKTTQRHHEGEYVDTDKLANSLEICTQCHSKHEMQKRLEYGEILRVSKKKTPKINANLEQWL